MKDGHWAVFLGHYDVTTSTSPKGPPGLPSIRCSFPENLPHLPRCLLHRFAVRVSVCVRCDGDGRVSEFACSRVEPHLCRERQRGVGMARAVQWDRLHTGLLHQRTPTAE